MKSVSELREEAKKCFYQHRPERVLDGTDIPLEKYIGIYLESKRLDIKHKLGIK